MSHFVRLAFEHTLHLATEDRCCAPSGETFSAKNPRTRAASFVDLKSLIFDAWRFKALLRPTSKLVG